MKNLNYIAVAFATLLLAACSQIEQPAPASKPVNGEYTYTFNLGGATKSAFSTDHMAWQSGDVIGWFTDKAGSSAVNMSTTPRSFTVNSASALAAGSSIYAYAPYKTGDQSKTSVPMSIPVSQNGSTVKDAMPMVAIPVTLDASMAAATDKPIGTAKFVNLGAMVQYNVYTTDATYAAEKVESVSFTASSAIAGDFTVDLTAVSESSVPAIDGLSESSVTSSLAAPATVGASQATGVKLYQVIAPGVYTGTMTVTTDVAVYEYKLSTPAQAFDRSQIRPANLDLASAAAKRTVRLDKLLTAHEWLVTSVAADWGYGLDDDTQGVGNIISFNADGSLSFDCTINGGYWDYNEGDYMTPEDVDQMSWQLSGSTLTFSPGYPLFMWGPATPSSYEIEELDDDHLVISANIEDWGGVYYITFTAALDPATMAMLTAHTWVVSGVTADWDLDGNRYDEIYECTLGNKINFNPDYSLSFDCSANGGCTYNYYSGYSFEPENVNQMRWIPGKRLLFPAGSYPVLKMSEGVSSFDIETINDSQLVLSIIMWGYYPYYLSFVAE